MKHSEILDEGLRQAVLYHFSNAESLSIDDVHSLMVSLSMATTLHEDVEQWNERNHQGVSVWQKFENSSAEDLEDAVRNMADMISCAMLRAQGVHTSDLTAAMIPVDESGYAKGAGFSPKAGVAMQSMWAFASGMVAKHGEDGDGSMTAAEHAAFREAAGKCHDALRDESVQPAPDRERSGG